jgi:hypothetical protein
LSGHRVFAAIENPAERARNPLSAASGGTSEVYDALGRRLTSTGGGLTQSFYYDGSTPIAWSFGPGTAYNFITIPGGGALAGTYSSYPNSTSVVPLVDASGSTIALVNTASLQSNPQTTYTYDPSGNPSVSGTANYWPFLYHGMEKQPTDPAPYYYGGSGQFHSPTLVRSLSGVGQTSSSGPAGGPAGNAIAPPSGSQSGFSLNPAGGAENESEGAAAGLVAGVIYGGESGALAYGPVGAAIGAAIGAIASFFEDIFSGGSDAPPLPRQLMHARHPLYPVILGVQVVDEMSAGKPELCGDEEFCGINPLQKVEYVGPSSPDCSEYAKACAQCGDLDTYDCQFAPFVCSNTPSGPSNPRSNCIRSCLQTRRALEMSTSLGCISGYLGGVVIPDLEVDHVLCLARCAVRP